jgi:hypothetical protein
LCRKYWSMWYVLLRFLMVALLVLVLRCDFEYRCFYLHVCYCTINAHAFSFFDLIGV